MINDYTRHDSEYDKQDMDPSPHILVVVGGGGSRLILDMLICCRMSENVFAWEHHCHRQVVYMSYKNSLTS